MIWPMTLGTDVSKLETLPDAVDFNKLSKNGVLLIRGVFSRPEVATMRRRVEAVVDRALRDHWEVPVGRSYPDSRIILGDLLGMEELSDLDFVVFDSRAVGFAKRLLGKDVVYFGDSCIRVGSYHRGFHKDFVDDTPPTAGGVRFVLYLQDHSQYSGGLKVRLRSHGYVSRHRGRMMNIPTRPGDLVVFYLRSSHTGNNVQLKLLPGLCLHPKLENLIPCALREREECRRFALLWTFGVRGSHLDRYIEWITRDPAHWRRCGYSRKLLELADRKGVGLLKAVPDHGSLWPKS